MSCDHDCEETAEFPRKIVNRPGLPRIDYSIGAYADLRRHMLRLLNGDPALAAWTHRGADDPGIALLEGAAIVGDILTFYQELYANEQYLRTAQWRDSVAELVRLLGYRLTPGLGGEATFALTVKGTAPVVLPQGFGLKADLAGGGKTAEFESTRETTAHPHLSEFRLYRPLESVGISTGTRTFYVPATAGPALELAAGDRVLVGEPLPSAAAPTRLAGAQVLVVAESWESFGARYVEFTTPVQRTPPIAELKAYKLGESYRHFGHDAPATTVTPSGDTFSASATEYKRPLDAPATAANPIVAATEMPLDTQVDGLAPGHYMIVQVRLGGAEQVFVATDRLARVAAPPAVELAGAALETTETHFAAAWRPPHAGSIVHRTPARYTLVRKIADVENRSYTWGMVSGASTVVTLDLSLATDGNDEADIRTFTFHEVTAEPFALRAEPRPSALDRGSDLYYYGTDAQAQALRGRAVLLCRAGEDPEAVTVTDVEPGSAGALETFRRVALDRSVSYADFPHEEPTTLVYGNLVAATQGKTESQVVLGSGDQRKAFQTFAVPKAPLTYLLDETQSPAHVPELTVLVDGVEWTPVDSFFNYGSDDAVYVVREDAEHKSYIQFGDGKNGRRLPSGRGNVTLIYRVGSGATGLPKPGAKPSIAGKLKDFVKLDLPGAVTVGAGPETADGARLAAPGKIQSLGRMVSLADIEAEALALPHVRKALATWSAPDGVPLVRLVVLTESETVADLAAVRDSVQTFNRCRGPARYAIDVVHGALQFVYLRIVAGYDAARREADVAATIRRALGVVGGGEEGAGGLFALESRRFGENAHTSQVIGAVQNAAGVAWVRLDGAAILSLGSPPQADPLALALPTVDVVQPVLACQSDRVLALHSTHLILVLSQDVTRDGCSV